MADLIVLGYDNEAKAQEAFDEVEKLAGDYIVSLSGLALVTADEQGKRHVRTAGKIMGASTAMGALWGILIGLLFLVPGLGLIIGGIAGAVSGTLTKMGIDKVFKQRVDSLLQPGKSAVVILANAITEDKFEASMARFGGTVLKTSLSDEVEKELERHLEAKA